ncbi:hypothetical protein FOMPIDRAFT_1144623 [Fomitopsis schrenkii]|uniref:Uncharacterized protein n=1 Tax=Fomitopsis schrenkii TaxID=2126942 RepID=S8FU09_FOMSC|nr:hypothetical protein FOMPIDRAFT_1144623 [Fomitopsis schrenkii]
MKLEHPDDGDWEDVPEIDFTPASRTLSISPSPSASTTRMNARRRKPAHKKAYPTPPTSSRRSATPAVPVREETPAFVNREEVMQAVASGASSSAAYVADVLSTAFWLLKKPLGVLAFIAALGILSGYVLDRFQFVFSPLCIVPGVSSSALCVRHIPVSFHPGKDNEKKPKKANFDRLVELQNSFGGVMNANVVTSSIGLRLKQSEIATHDLVTLVRYSELKGRDILVEALKRFVDDAKLTGEGLHTLSAKINGAVDRITAVNDYAMQTIESVSKKGGFSLSRIISAFGSAAEGAILRSFSDAMDTLARETQRTLLEASASVANLERLQEHLLTIHDICEREGVELGEAHAELLSALWTALGGNRRTVRRNELHLALLKEVGRYRKEALMHVVVTRDVLQALAADVEELRASAAAPEIVGDSVPPEVLIRSIGSQVERLKEERQRASERQQAMMDKMLAAPDVFGTEDE